MVAASKDTRLNVMPALPTIVGVRRSE
jgi:hypothetical protein